MMFMLERNADIFSFVIKDSQGIIIIDLEAEWQTFEIVFDMSEGVSAEVSLYLNGVLKVDKYEFNPVYAEINNIYMHTSRDIYKSRTDIKFEYLYDYLAT